MGLPTDTVYGLATRADDAAAVERLFKAKQREATKPIALLVDSWKRGLPYISEPPADAALLARRLWPGPLTLVLRSSGVLPSRLTAGRDTLGLRAPAHEVALTLLRQVGAPLATSSANISGETALVDWCAVEQQLRGQVDLILRGVCEIGIASTVLDMTVSPYRILRRGAITAARLAGLLPDQKISDDGKQGEEQ